MGSVWVTGDVITAARMNQKTLLMDTGANINSATAYTGMMAYCTSTGSGFTAGLTYQYNGSSWGLFGSVVTLQVADVYSSTIGDYTTPTSAVASSTLSTTVTVDNSGASNNGSTVTSVSLANFAIANNANRLLLVAIGSTGTTDPSSVTYGAQGMTLVPSSKTTLTGYTIWMYYLIAPAVSTTTAVTASWGGTGVYSITAVSYYNVDQTTPLGTVVSATNNSTSTITNNVTSTYINNRVFSALITPWNVQPTDSPTAPLVTRGAQSAWIISADQPAATVGTYANTWTMSGGSVSFNLELSIEVLGANINPVSNLFDGNTATEWISKSETHPYAYVDMGSTLLLTGAAIYWDGSTTTATQILVQTSPDASTWTTVRTINTNLLTNGAWNYFRWNLPITALNRYVRFYGNDGTAKVLAIWEIKIKQYANTTAGLQNLFVVHGHPTISSSVATTPLAA